MSEQGQKLDCQVLLQIKQHSPMPKRVNTRIASFSIFLFLPFSLIDDQYALVLNTIVGKDIHPR